MLFKDWGMILNLGLWFATAVIILYVKNLM